MEFVWHDLMARDPARAQSFYQEVFGWNCRDEGTFKLLCAGERPIAAILPLGPGVPGSHWVSYLGVADVAATCEKVRALGGSVCIAGAAHPLGGQFAFLSDSQAAYFSVLSEAPGGAGFAHEELVANDPARAGDFYQRLCGWEPGAAPAHTRFHDAGRTVAWMIPKPPGAIGFWLPHAVVADLNAAVGRALALGATLFVAPKHVPGIGSYAVLIDPVGAAIAAIVPEETSHAA
jgi:predicted enzyme related to lactoylglutathione lyase